MSVRIADPGALDRDAILAAELTGISSSPLWNADLAPTPPARRTWST
jgi:cytosine/uracil/thiamine/allantoin permease